MVSAFDSECTGQVEKGEGRERVLDSSARVNVNKCPKDNDQHCNFCQLTLQHIYCEHKQDNW